MIDTEKLKTIDAEIVLNTLGLPYKKTGDRLMALAAYRDENTASISIQKRGGKWLWKDFGSGKGGSWIDLVMSALNLNYVDAIKFLNNIGNAEVNDERRKGKENFFLGRQEKKSSEIKATDVTKVADLELINYLRSRRVSFIPDWLKQIDYKVIKDNKTYLNFAVGIKNSAGGYAVRNTKIKMNIGRSAYSLFAPDAKKEPIFTVEGLFDGLTVAEKMKDKDYNLIILNSTENLNNKVIEVLSGYKFIIIGFDNDPAGINAENEIIEKINNSEIYKLKFRANDLNEAWVLEEKIEIVKLK